MYYTKESLEVRIACSKDETRPALQNVLLKDGVSLATDGHVLFRVGKVGNYDASLHPEKQTGIKLKNCQVLISNESAEKLRKAIPRKTSLPILEGFWLGLNKDKSLCAVVTDLDNSTSVSAVACKTKTDYPNVNSVWPTGKPVKITEIGFSATILKKLAEFVKKARPNNPGETIKLTFYGATKGVVFDAGINEKGQKIDGIIMPLRIAE